MSDIVSVGQEYSSLVGEDSSVIGPVRQVGSELGGDFSFKGLECIEH